jgi:uncharacterized protein (TIRG00374 family)
MPEPFPDVLKPAPEAHPATTASTPQQSAWWKWVLRLAIGGLIVGVLLRWQGASVVAALQSATPQTLLLAVAGYLAIQMLSAFKWRLLLNAALRAQGDPSATPLSFGECYRFYLIGMFCNLWLPTAVGGDAVRAALAGKRCRSLALAASAIFVERLTGLAALLVVGVLGALFYFGLVPQSDELASAKSRLMSVAIITTLIILALLFAVWALRRGAEKFSKQHNPSPFAQKLLGAHRAFDIYFSPATRPALGAALALSLAFHIALIGLNIFLAAAVELKLPAAIFAWLVPSLGIASMLPIGIGGLGVREAGAIAFLNGVLPVSQMPDAGTVIAWSLLWQATIWVAGLPGAFAYFAANNHDSKLKTQN